MSTIRTVYHPVNGMAVAPRFPATDQHPDAVRYRVGLYFVDAVGGAPTQAELDAVLNPAPVQRTVEQKLAAVGLTVAELQAVLAK